MGVKSTHRWRVGLGVFAVSTLASQFAEEAAAAPFILPSVPLIVSIDSVPNIWFQVDDSGSMEFEVLAGPHYPSCRYNPVMQCSDTTPPNAGRMQLWTGQWQDDDENEPHSATISYIFELDSAVYRAGDRCDESNWDTDRYQNYHNGDPGAMAACLGEYGDTGSRRQWGDTRSFDIDRDWRIRSPDLNVQYFSPDIQYVPWLSPSATYPDSSFTSARAWPVSGEAGYSESVNLDNASGGGAPFWYNIWIDDRGYSGATPSASPLNMTHGSNGEVDQWDSHIRVTVTSAGVSCQAVSHDPEPYRWPRDLEGINPTETSIDRHSAACLAATGSQSDSALRQNVANWFTYYRSRHHLARGAIGNVVTQLPDFRYGVSFINQTGDYHAIPEAVISDYDANASAMVDTLYTTNRGSYGTPLRNGLKRVGDIYAGDNAIASPVLESCQKNYALLFTDGFWNGNYGGPPSGDVDGDGETLGGNNGGTTLADVAAWYYRNDLDTNMANAVPTDSFDSANWQHMVSYTVAFGIEGALQDTDGDGWPNPPLDDSDDWYTHALDDFNKVDDLWHAAWNSRGRYFNARRPEELYESLEKALADIASRIGGAASAAANSGSISSTSRIFQAKFDTSDWHGELLAYPVNDDGTLGSAAVWNANDLLNAKSDAQLASNAGGRNVWTWNNDGTTPGGTAFEWSAISDAQKALLNVDHLGNLDGLGQQRLRYIRGESLNEISRGGSFRNRTNALGDIVNSDPLYVGFPPFFYSFGSYQAFFNSHRDRTGVIYVGANDGMLHAIRESDGEELFAYVPDRVMDGLPALTNPSYSHRFYVDGAPAYGDVETGSGWRSLLAGGLRAGGQGVFALDVTDPDGFSASDVLWEFTDEVDADLGYTFSQPQIKKMADGRWAVIVGNGINNTTDDGHASTTGAGALFILFVEAGIDGWQAGDYVKIPVPGGSALDPNALFTPAAADVDGDHRVDYIYAGDRHGKMWKFDVTDPSPANWQLAFGNSPLFDAGAGHPITDRPAIAAHPAGRDMGQLVLFGTGQFIQPTDNTTVGQPTQSLYAIWDFDTDWATAKSVPVTDLYGNTRAELAAAAFTVADGQRVMSGSGGVSWLDDDGNPDDLGWYVDLPTAGERIVRRAVLRDDLVFFVTMIPNDDSCAAGGTGWVMAMDFSTGQAPGFPVFDADGDLDVTREGDLVEAGDPDDISDNLVPVGVQAPSIPNLPALIYDDRPGFSSDTVPFPPQPNQPRGCDVGNARAYTFTTGSNGSIMAMETATEALNCGRQNWRRKR